MVKFSKNWNRKLDCDVFTTIRKYTKEKEEFYRKQIGNSQNIYLKGKLYCKANLLDVMVMSFCDVPFEILALDTGIPNRAVLIRVFSRFGIGETDKVIILIFSKEVSADSSHK